MYKSILGIIISAFILNTFFVNCGDSDLKQLGEEMNSSSTSPDPINSDEFDSNEPLNQNKVQLEIRTTPDVATDCSKDTALIEVSVKNGKSDFWACLEHKLDVPNTSVRFGEKEFCDHPSKFVSLAQHPDYKFDAKRSVWQLKNGSIKTKGDLFVPGHFRMLVLDNQGETHASKWFYLGRSSHANCTASSALNSAGLPSVCSWNIQNPKFVIGPSPVAYPPSRVCNKSTVDSIEYGHYSAGDKSEYYYKCDCN